jgi:hypothetical protein
MMAVHFDLDLMGGELLRAAAADDAEPGRRATSDCRIEGGDEARLSVATISFGDAPARPDRTGRRIKVMPSSSMVGISGSTAVRRSVATPSARTFPRICGTTEDAVANIIRTWPAITSCKAAAPL